MTNNEAEQNAIKEAYGIYWEKVKDYVDSNDGWCSDNVYYKKECPVISEIERDTTYTRKDDGERMVDCFNWRPKSLSGIEDNNGWIIIESEEDLPKEYCSCWVIVDEVIINKPLHFNPFTKRFDDGQLFQEYLWFSHYQPTIKPKPPIY